MDAVVIAVESLILGVVAIGLVVAAILKGGE